MGYVIGSFIGNRIAAVSLGQDVMVFTMTDFGLVMIASVLSYGILKLIRG